MASIRSDRLVFGLGISGTILFLLLTLHSTMKEVDHDVNCWVPGHFSEAHVEYSNHVCQYEEHRHPPPVNFTDRQTDQRQMKSSVNNFCSLAYYGIQAVVLFISYHLLSSIAASLTPAARAYKCFGKRKELGSSQASSKENLLFNVGDVGVIERSSCAIMVSYLITQAVTSFSLIGLGMRSLAEYSSIHQEPEKNHTFFCEFDVRVLGSIQRYTVQCVEDEESGGMVSLLTKGVPYMNTVLCLVLVVMITIHLITMLSCGSRARRYVLRITADKQAIDDEVNSISGCLSDMNLIALVANENLN